MSTVWQDLSKAIGKPSEDIETQAAFNWITSEISESDRRIATFIRLYRVTSPNELENSIRTGGLEGHPAWEDAIDWFNLLEYRQNLLKVCAELNRGQAE